VTAAKAEVRGDVEIDFLAGPSELLVVADETAEPGFVAADLLAQAEHDPDASVVAVTDDEATADAICEELEERIDDRARAETIEEALGSDASGVFVARSMSEAVLFAEAYAAEHLSIQADDDEAILDRVDSAGSVFLGPYAPVAAGDYATGTNHVLPTNGQRRSPGPQRRHVRPLDDRPAPRPGRAGGTPGDHHDARGRRGTGGTRGERRRAVRGRVGASSFSPLLAKVCS